MVNDLSSIDDLELMPLGGGYMVRRERLMNELIAKGRKAGIVVLYAPDGFGKTIPKTSSTGFAACALWG